MAACDHGVVLINSVKFPPRRLLQTKPTATALVIK